ncbi:MAG: dihydroflavonol-4-reductase [Rhodothalassiaceae bacterium]|nr:MAG: dihydroflavonol-4-reductase [Rhodothalassiaceae bacterium]
MIAEPVLVTGGAGFLGRRLVARLVAEGARVRVLDPAASEDDPALAGAEIVAGSVTDREAVRRALTGVRTVFHMAAITHLWLPDPRAFRRVNYEGTVIMLEEAWRAGVERFLHTVSEVVLRGWNDPDPTPITEDSPTAPVTRMAGPYSRSKWWADQAVRNAIAAGFPAVILYPAIPVGPDDRSRTPPTRMLEQFLFDPPPAYLDCALNLLDADDIVSAHLLAARRAPAGRRYVIGTRATPMARLLAIIAEITGRPPPRRRVPFRLALLTAWLAERRAARSGRTPLASCEGVRLARHPRPLDARRAGAELGWRPRDPADALRAAAERLWRARARD